MRRALQTQPQLPLRAASQPWRCPPAIAARVSLRPQPPLPVSAPNSPSPFSCSRRTFVSSAPGAWQQPRATPATHDGSSTTQLDATPFSLTPGHPRTHKCGDLRDANVGSCVVLNGWSLAPRKIGANIAFLPVRDYTGTAQLVHELDPESPSSVHLRETLLSLTPESIVCARGTVRSRPADAISPSQATGNVEVVLDSLEVLNPAAQLPFSTAPLAPLPTEENRLKFRYVDLRRPALQRNIRLRALAATTVRQFLNSRDFIEVETPLLFKSTPEGAREFLVPTRAKGQFYALPQSPQQYKQVLMSAGVDRYYQIAKCFRDESLGADRQPEFTQIDMEMSFAGMEDVMEVMEALVKKTWTTALGTKFDGAFPRITYDEAMRRFGSDKPDTRFEMEICDMSAKLLDASDAGIAIEAFRIPRGSDVLTTKEMTKILDTVTQEAFPLLGGKVAPGDLVFVRVPAAESDKPWLAKVKFISADPAHVRTVLAATNAEPGDIIVINRRVAGILGPHTPLGRARLLVSKTLAASNKLDLPPSRLDFLWVHSFPLFSPTTHPCPAGETPNYESTHHPFTAPTPQTLSHLLHEPQHVLGQHYDLVLNGQEIGGGSVRIHDPHLQRTVFAHILRMSEDRIERDFGHLLAALAAGCPPHAGMALGFDRLVALLCGAASIRDVIAFPKLSGGDLFVESPAGVAREKLEEYHLEIV
ncbi:aspartyl-tRNA synthetase [Geranomyces variabilis]|nr:aspartyl-tRNA synthetase [Geranomyces variabilis]KAJ3135614.1 hypothetical protein HDU90_003688 [Geranomyces variabilis]